MDTIFEFKDSREKQRVREELWKPIFEEIRSHKKNIKYLGLPGPKCFDLDKFLKLNFLDLKNTYSVEREGKFIDQIKQFYTKNGNSPVPYEWPIFQGDVLHLLTSSETDLKENFPFDIVNLDLYGSPFDTNKYDESKIFTLLNRTITLQKLSSKKLFLMVTVKLDTPQKLSRRTLKTTKDFKNHVLEPIFKSNPNETLRTRLDGKYRGKDDLIKIYSIILHSVYQSSSDTNIGLFSKPYTYIGISANKTTRMLSYVLEISYPSGTPLSVAKINERRQGLIDQAVSLIEKTVRIN